MKKLALGYLALFSIAGVVIAVDQITKSQLRDRLAMGETWPVEGWLLGLFKFVHTVNTGAAFSMGQGFGLLFMGLAIAVSVGIIAYYPRLPQGEPLLRVAVGLLLGGIVGNLIDRLTVGQVTDFLAIRFFAVINVADACITVGTGLLILWSILKEMEEKKRKQIEE